MGSDAVFGYVMHFPRTDLDFDRLSPRADNRRMEGLVVIGLRHSNIVFKAIGQGLPETVHDAQDAITILYRIDDDADGIEVIDLAQVAVVLFHFFINAVEMLGPAVDFELDVGIFQGLTQDFNGFIDDFFADVAFLLHLVDEIVIFIRFEIAEG